MIKSLEKVGKCGAIKYSVQNKTDPENVLNHQKEYIVAENILID